MKKHIIGIFVCVLMIGSVLTSAAMNVEQDLIEEGKISVIVAVESYDVKLSDLGDEVLVENFGRLLVPGKPNLPSKIFTIAIPPGAELIDVCFEATESVVLEGIYDITPSPLPRVIGDEDPVIYQQELNKYNENFNEIYSNNELYPSSVGEFVRKAGYRKYNLVDVRINPFSYNPISGELIFYPEIKVDIKYMISEDFAIENAMVDNLAKTEKLAEKIIYNYDEARNWYPSDSSGRESYDYVIITIDSLNSSIQDLVDWEESKGRDVKVVTTSWINSNYAGYDLAEKIRNFLRDKYPSSEWGIEDVCIIGHYDDVPMRRCAQDLGYGKPETDFYYAELSLPDSQSWDADGDHQYGENSDPIDFIAEVNVGRIPWSTPATVDDICEKSVDYEQNNDASFKKNILLLGAFFWADTDNAVLMEAKEAETRGLEPMARIVSMGWAGVDPSVMGRGPVPATVKALGYAGLSVEDIDYWEINEAFSIVPLNCMDKLKIPEEKVNVKGGSIAIGHPLGSTMIRLTGTLARILKDKKAKHGIANACVGGGQGVATVIENLDT